MKAGVDWDRLRNRLAEGQAAVSAARTIAGDRLEELLLARAKLLADPTVVRRDRGRSNALVVRAGDERYALELARLAGIVPFRTCSPVPGAPPETLGVITARGEIWAVFDFRLLFTASRPAAPESGYVLLMRHDKRRVGVRVDDVERVCDLSRSKVVTLDDQATGVQTELIDETASAAIILVRSDAVWNHSAVREAT